MEEVRGQDFLTAGAVGGIYIPFDAVQNLIDGNVVLNIPAEDVDLQSWPRPPSISSVSSGMDVSPGPAGPGMPFAPPGTPTGFAGAKSPDAPVIGTGGLTGDTEISGPGELGPLLGEQPTLPTTGERHPGEPVGGREPAQPEEEGLDSGA
ncbi:hypothetical protein NITHO_1940002 [Nitrolancea hollandica Lb]|uniref:Uncharacterized protein n=1 Tax=Nitrolancea hollandica Lb TaxID=1129897 RepID=I4EEP1_9BACT|nr:hypothetical protein NITHO_1940002 [Nitrolancea hollandica Lb]